ncbi:toll-like receptor 4 [Crassostrea angulata]|uniref:toll-like receptor 4 n=1 Tax=Magallana angulata TaxID=2784310 RepID=UPI0022B1BF01|nr:toll-like receptor 4 [Crassostrea angulata]
MVVFFCGTLQKVVLHLFIITKAFATLHKKSWDNCYFGSAECKCQKVPNNLLKADCSGRRLHTLPVFNTSVIWIDLSNNEISNISSGFPRNVSYINLSENNIQELVMHPFHRLSNLKTLNLERNMINITMVYSGLFADLTSLTELSLKGNIQNKFKPTVIKDDVFSELKSLETLKIDGPANVTFGKGFQNITMLQKLDLSGITGNCSFQRISHNMFLNMPKLTYVDVSACDILDIEEGAFGKLQYLEHLDVSYNKQLGFASLPNITHNLNKTSIRVLRGNGINCLSGIGTKILKRHFENLKHTNISEIYFEKNRLEQLEPGAFRLLPNTITSISFGENKLTQGRYILDYFFLQNIRVYNISVQLRPPPFPESIFEQCAEKTDVLHENKQYFDNEDIQEKEGNKYESMMNDFIGSKWNEHHVTFYIPKTLEVLYANMSRLYGTVPEFGINATGAREIYAQDNFLYSWDGPIHGMENIKIMDLSNNFCSHISKSFLKYARGLTTLRMSKNDIGKSLSSDMEGEIFKNTVSMKVLDLSYNNIVDLSAPMFKNLERLQTLNLQNNQLSTWRVKVDHMKSIQFINLKQNRLTTFGKEAQMSLTKLFQITNLSIDLSGNQFLCSCDSVHFLEWITGYRNRVVHFKRYECSSTSSHKFNFSDADNSLKLLKKNCKSYLVIYIVTSVAVAIMFCIIFGIFLLKNKWKIRYVIYRFKQRFKTYTGHSIIPQADSPSYEYDIMISYSPKQLSFVLTDVIPRLENEAGFQLYIKDRDEPAGISCGEAIMEAIQKSKRVVCLVTKSFLKSTWQDYELNMSRMEAIEDRENLNFVHLILFPDVCNGSISIQTLDLVRQECFSEYPEEECAFDDFWETLISHIKELNRY